jgi:hypothetical protein
MLTRLLRILAPSALVVAALSTGAFAQTTTSTQQGVNAATPAPNAAKLPKAPPDVFNNQSHPAPTATPQPGQLMVDGRLRGYQFNRINTPLEGQFNKKSYEFDFAPHLDYRFGDTPLSVGYTYSGATGFGLNGPNPGSPAAQNHVDNTLPGFPLNQEASELYLQYKDPTANIIIGNQVLNYPWTPNSDSRITPVSYQAIDATFNINSKISVSATRIARWEMRNASTFTPYTLLTAQYAAGSPLSEYGYSPSGHPGTYNPAETPGVLRIGGSYHPSGRYVLTAEDYEFYDIVNLAYVESRYAIDPYSPANPYIAGQFVGEKNTGAESAANPAYNPKSQIGVVDNETIGFQLGTNIAKGLQLVASTDLSPWNYAYSTNPSGFFLGSGVGTDVAVGKNAAGKTIYKVAYGGIASPYTDGLGTDPLYTTMITQGMADRRAAGEGYKAAFIYTTPGKQFRLIADEAWFNYSNEISRALVSEFNVDGTYYFNKVRPGPYKGFFVRVRIAPRQQPNLPYNFEYQRFITEYDF